MTGRKLLLALALLAALGLAPAAKAVTVTSADRFDLSNAMDWCESTPEAEVGSIAAGGCRFAPTTPATLGHGYTSRAFWLRLTLTNPENRAVERWLQVGQSRLERVSFFEKEGDGWKRTDAGAAIPAARRPVVSVDPLLPVTLAPLESRTLLVRIASRSSINLTSALWRPRAYAEVQGRTDIQQALALGGLLMAALVSLMIALTGRVSQWSSRANLYFSASLATKAVFNACITGQLSTWLLPNGWSFDIRVQAVAMSATAIFFLFFLRHYAETRVRYPRFDLLFHILIAVLLLEAAAAVLGDFSLAFRAMTLTTSAFMLCAITLLWRAWRGGMPASGYLLAAYAINFSLMVHRIVMAFAGSYYSDGLVLVYSWIHLLTVPLTPIGIALHEDAIRRDLDAARKESAARVEFLARMSHELRTPLDTILGNAQLLSRPNGKALLAEGLATIQDSGWHLLRMIDDILDHARGLAGRLRIVPVAVDWPGFLRAVEADAARVAARNGNSFILRREGPPLQRIRFDEGRLRQVLDNLIANAARHTAQGRIELACVVEPAGEGLVTLDFSVTDTGEGIAFADQQRIFLPFERGGQTVSRHGGKGLGMGLTISRQLVEMMGGRLTVASRPGEGARFRFRLVAEREDDAPASGETAQGACYDGPRRTLLLVDDDDGNRRVLATFLRGAGFEVIEAGSGRAAMAAPVRPDLVLTDQFMADGDGWMVLQAMARRDPDIPVVSISAAPPERPARFPPELGFALHLMKPLDHDKLLRCIGDLLGLDWGDARAEPAPAGSASMKASFANWERPDPVGMAALSAMIEDGRISDIQTWAAALKAAQPRCAGFADAVHAAASRLDFPTLKALSAPAGHEAAS